MDRGPFVIQDSRLISSGDFNFDVMLSVSGDFGDENTRKRYMVWLAQTLNTAIKRQATKA